MIVECENLKNFSPRLRWKTGDLDFGFSVATLDYPVFHILDFRVAAVGNGLWRRGALTLRHMAASTATCRRLGKSVTPYGGVDVAPHGGVGVWWMDGKKRRVAL